jgi:hypothetical protein
VPGNDYGTLDLDFHGVRGSISFTARGMTKTGAIRRIWTNAQHDRAKSWDPQDQQRVEERRDSCGRLRGELTKKINGGGQKPNNCIQIAQAGSKLEQTPVFDTKIHIIFVKGKNYRRAWQREKKNQAGAQQKTESDSHVEETIHCLFKCT